ncbi:MAG: sigma 54-interacting transcriptional regulator, partial [Vicinamibacterales bacterium]
ANLGLLDMVIGRFDEAHRRFEHLLHTYGTSARAADCAADGMARAQLACGDLERCSKAFEVIDEYIARNPEAMLEYHVRWSGITRARMMARSGDSNGAISWLQALRTMTRTVDDRAFDQATLLCLAFLEARQGDLTSGTKHLIEADKRGVTQNRELQAQFYLSAAVATGGDLGAGLEHRAFRVWNEQKVASVPLEMGYRRTPPDDPPQPWSPRRMVNALSSLLDLAYSPHALGEELTAIVNELGCSNHRIVREVNSNGPDEDGTMSLVLGATNKRVVRFVCRTPSEPSAAILLSDVLRIGRAAVALENARREERNKAALWPESPVEEQAGAIFLAEEMQSLLATARRIASTNIPVLITGETGTGKEVIARMVHAYSPRASKTFLPFNCTATPRDMLDGQLFGHRRGAFTGATENFSGIIRAAAGGTLFLDEIGETPLDIQPKLLRFLEAAEVHPIGEAHPVKVDVRVIAATNVQLDDLVAQGRFREDLFYRLNIVRLHVPPLRERRVEIPALANHYLQKHALESGKRDLRLGEETMEYLVLYKWPGNVRQLANEMRRMAALAEDGAVLMPEHLSTEIAASRRTIPASERTLDPVEVVVRMDQPLPAAVQHLERAMIQHAMMQCGGRIEETATALGLSRKGLYLKRQRLGIDVGAGEGDLEVV